MIPVRRGLLPWSRGLLFLLCLLMAFPAQGFSHNFAPGKTKRLRSRTSSNLAHDNHYLFGPSAIPMERGTGYYQNQDILMHSVHYAPTDGLTIGGGVQAASLFSSLAAGSHGPMFHVRMNGGGSVGNGLHMGGFVMGVRIGTDLSLNDEVRLPTTIGLGAAQATFGTDPFQVTVSIGTTVDRTGAGDGPLVSLAGLWHITEHVAFITENWNIPFGPEQYRIYSYGARITHRAMAFDAAFAINEDLGEIFFLGVPVLGFSLRL